MIAIVALMSSSLTSVAQTENFSQGWTFWSDRNEQKTIVSLPHDAMLTEQRSDTVGDGRHNGFYPGGVYHYEKTIDVPKAWLSKHVVVHFDGAYRNATISLNGTAIASHAYGYTPFSVSLDGHLQEGRNVFRVDINNGQTPNSRWYSGAGIYRPVKFTVQEQSYIDDVRITTRSIEPAIVSIAIAHKHGTAVCDILWKGQVVVHGRGDSISLAVPDAHLWSAEEPNLYQLRVRLMDDGVCTDSIVRNFGIREITWSSRGFFVNGQQVLLRGGCLHHDNGILGACEYYDAALRKVALLKEYGYNAIRSSHNPTSEAMLQACDSLGMYVIDELWDMWYSEKTAHDYAFDWASHHDEDMLSMVSRDYNHPSVVMYSIGNEVTEPYNAEGVATAQKLVSRMHELDNTRPVTCGINLTLLYLRSLGMNLTQSAQSAPRKEEPTISSEDYNKMIERQGRSMLMAVRKPEVDSISSPVLDCLDIAGYNYGSMRYADDAVAHPDRIIVGTETYCQDLFDNWQMVERLPYVVGDFMWTAIDYLGEVGIGTWLNTTADQSLKQQYPAKLAYSGAIDLIGNPTGEAFLAKAIWLKESKPYITVRPISHHPLIKSIWRGTNSIPSWSWRGMDGTDATVEVFTSADSVRLYLNDKFIGEKAVEKAIATFTLPYQPGILRAVAIDADGHEQAAELTSASGALSIQATTEKDSYHVGDLIYLDVAIADSYGTVEANADTRLTITVDGADLLGFGSAQPITADRFTSGSYTTYQGRALAALQATQRGDISICIKGDGLPALNKTLTIK